jgi:hypothetical protein
LKTNHLATLNLTHLCLTEFQTFGQTTTTTAFRKDNLECEDILEHEDNLEREGIPAGEAILEREAIQAGEAAGPPETTGSNSSCFRKSKKEPLRRFFLKVNVPCYLS